MPEDTTTETQSSDVGAEQSTEGAESTKETSTETVVTEEAPKETPTEPTEEKSGKTEAAPKEETVKEEVKETSTVLEPGEYKVPDGLPKEEIGKFAHDLGLSQEGLDKTLQLFGNYVQAQTQSRLVALRQMGEAHVKNWGEESKYKLSLAKLALKQNDPDGALAKALEESGYGNHPAVLDFLANLGKSMEEGGYIKSNPAKMKAKKTLAQRIYSSMDK